MKFGLVYNTAFYGLDPEAMIACARHAEACGFESFLLPEHIAQNPGATMSGVPVDPTLPIADPLACLAFIAAATDRILLGTGILQLPYHHPVTLAKRLATIDVLSKGRMRLLTVGLGPFPGQAEAVGVDFATRGRRADEAIDVLRLLWAGGPDGVSFDGQFFSFKNLCSYPKPHDAVTLPIHIGGSTRAAARRAGLRGDGYFAGGRVNGEERAHQFELMRRTAVEAGRDPGRLDYTRWGSMDLSPADVADFRANGATRIVLGGGAIDLQERLDEINAFAHRHGIGPGRV